MAKVKIEIKKPQYLAPKTEPKAPVKKVTAETAGGLPGFFKFLLFLTYVLFGYAIWTAAQLFIKK